MRYGPILLVTFLLAFSAVSGCLEEDSKRSSNKKPVAKLRVDKTVINLGETIQFDATESFDPDGKIIRYMFFYGDGTNSGELDDGFAEHTYTDPGEMEVSVVVWDTKRGTGIETFSIRVNTPPIARMNITRQDTGLQTTTAKVQETLNFDASRSEDGDGEIFSYIWDFDDGEPTTTTQSVVSHRFEENGTYDVTLTVEDDDGATDSITTKVNVFIRTYKARWNHTEANQAESLIGYASEDNPQTHEVNVTDPNIVFIEVILTWTDDGDIPISPEDDPNDIMTVSAMPDWASQNKTQTDTDSPITINWTWNTPSRIFEAHNITEANEIAETYNMTDWSNSGLYTIYIEIEPHGYLDLAITDPGNEYQLDVNVEYYTDDFVVDEI